MENDTHPGVVEKVTGVQSLVCAGKTSVHEAGEEKRIGAQTCTPMAA
jgi:hypothetical protein